MQTESIEIPIEVVEANTAALADVNAGIETIGKTTQDISKKQDSFGTSFKKSWTEINSAIGVAKQAYQLVKKAVDETVGAYVNYANQVRTISQVTGQQAEDVSRLIQLTDDYKIKTESLELVMKKLASEGLPLTTESLAGLSDEYLKLAPGVERQTFLTEKFGRAGTDFAEIMLAGGAAIRDQSAAVSDSLILTDAALKKARDYEIAQDNLADSINALKIAAGQLIVPILTTAMGYQTARMRADELGISLHTYVNGETGLKSILPLEKTHAQLLFDIAEAERVAAEKGGALNAQIKIEDGAFFRFNATLADNVVATDAVSASQDALLSTIGTLQSVTDKYNDTQDELIQKQTDIQTALDLAIRDGYLPTSEKIVGLKGDLEDVNTALKNAALAFEDESRRAIYAIMMQKAASDGWQPGELDKLLKLGVAWGIYSQNVVNEASNINSALNNESATLAQIQRYAEWQIAHPKVNMSFDYWLTTHGSPPDTNDRTIQYIYKVRTEGVFNPGYTPAPRVASGGYVTSRYAITGDARDGHRTGFEELVDFATRRVYNAEQTRAMVPSFANGSSPGGPTEIDLSPQSIRAVADVLVHSLAPFL